MLSLYLHTFTVFGFINLKNFHYFYHYLIIIIPIIMKPDNKDR